MTGVALGSAQGRWVVLTATLASAIALLDGTVVNVALRPIGLDLDATLANLQWVVNGYMLTLAGLVLVGGSLGDRLGLRRIFLIGTAGFAITSLACGLAIGIDQLIAARVLQGVAAALLTPSSLAIIQATITETDRPRAIGVWAAWSGISSAIGPLLGGWLIEILSWRWVFFINLPLTALVVLIAWRYVPKSPGIARDQRSRFDVTGAALALIGLGGITYALIQGEWLPAMVGLTALASFVVVEHHTAHPMLPLGVFTIRAFSAANVMTFVTYGALSALMFFLVLQLQVVSGYSPLQAGLATVPFTVLMLLFSPRVGALMARTGARFLMSAGPALAAVGVLHLATIGAEAPYATQVLPGVVLFGAGVTLMVTPLTATVMAAVPGHQVGIASGVNNAVARAGSLLAVAALPAIVGLSGDDYAIPEVFSAGYTEAMWWCAGFLILGGLISALFIPGRRARTAGAAR
ncbi:MFS transporter [Pseudactinotalea sp. Z1748]|uniref:MFS transporter n=1 Tax=Pseudactinotalea sp. Z1748 TaxID=3413027 RepID=UPI003C7A4E6C